MSFWNTFVKVWEVRTSIKIQESIENYFSNKRKRDNNFDNSSEIVDELISKNSSWNEKISKARDKEK
jgi:hypothetical protein